VGKAADRRAAKWAPYQTPWPGRLMGGSLGSARFMGLVSSRARRLQPASSTAIIDSQVGRVMRATRRRLAAAAGRGTGRSKRKAVASVMQRPQTVANPDRLWAEHGMGTSAGSRFLSVS